jgi:hypothetical protein
VAPYAFESGKFKGRRWIWGGRALVREALYMAAMSAGNGNSVLSAFRNRLKDTGKMPKVVIVALMRKMITMLNARVRDDVVWADHLHGRDSVPTVKVVAPLGRHPAQAPGGVSFMRTPLLAIAPHAGEFARPVHMGRARGPVDKRSEGPSPAAIPCAMCICTVMQPKVVKSP